MMSEKYFHAILGSDATGDGTATNPYKTYDAARAAAGSSDEVYGGGIGCGTWTKLRFCASDGNDSNNGMTPDTPKQSFYNLWNTLGTLTDDISVLILVKGHYTINTNPILSGGGRRSTTCTNTYKMLKGYTTNDYFGVGKVHIDLAGEDSSFAGISGNNIIIKNVSINAGTGYNDVIYAKTSSYGLTLDHCDIMNVLMGGINGELGLNNLTVTNCRFTGLDNIGYAILTNNNSLIRHCLFYDYATGIETMRGSIFGCLFNRCNYAISNVYADNTLIANTIFANSSEIAISNYGSNSLTAQTINSIFYNNDLDIEITRGGISVQGCCFSSNPQISVRKNTGIVRNDRSLIEEGCIVADPQFVDAANGDFRLKSTSPCWNMGLANPFLTGNIGHIGIEGKAIRGQRSRESVYANSRQLIIK
jgi:hypothetical protein